ncbi:MAG: MFS transporter, partial [Candidatus Acidiferrum sp.]
MAEPENSRAEGRAAFQYPSFVLFQTARFCIVLATEMQSVAVGWQVYEITKRPLDLGLVGLAQFLPGILLFLVSGHVADRYDRRKVVVVCYSGFTLCSALLLSTAIRGVRDVSYIFAVLALLGIVRSFNGPVSRALLPQLVPEEHFPKAVAWA